MNDEIKEILNKLQRVANRETASRNALMEMKDTDYQILLDYITNLQEENQRLKENNQNMQVEMAKSWERIDKAIEFINKLQENGDIEIWREDGYYAYILYILRGEDKQ